VANDNLGALKIEDKDRGLAPRRRNWVIAAVAAAALLLLLAVALPQRAARVQVAAARAPEAGPAPLLNASGYVTPRRRATVAAKITGRVLDVFADEGLVVKEGDVLARLDDAEARVALAAAERDRDVARAQIPDLEVNLANAERELKRYDRLRRETVVSEEALDATRTSAESYRAKLQLAKEQVRSAEARIAVARQDLENCTVRAPFAGIVVSKDAQRGEMVSPISAGGGYTRTGIATIVDMQSLEIEVDVNEANIARVREGQKVAATLDAYPEWRIPASVRTVIPTADRQKATVKVRIAFDALDPKILPDMGVKVAFLGEPEPGAAPRAIVPRAAVRNEDGGDVVYVLKDGRLARRPAKLGTPRGTEIDLVEGAAPGEQVVVGGPQRLRDGAKAVAASAD